MTGGKARPKKDKAMKVSAGQVVKTSQILARGFSAYKAGFNVAGKDPLYARCEGKIYFSKKKAPRGKIRTFINILPETQKTP